MTDRDELGRFLPGNNGGPGRSKGSRNKLSERVVEEVYAHWEQYGAKAIHRTYEEHPALYLKAVISILPKEFHVSDTSLDDFSNEELIDLLVALRSVKEESGGVDRVRAKKTSRSRKAVLQ